VAPLLPPPVPPGAPGGGPGGRLREPKGPVGGGFAGLLRGAKVRPLYILVKNKQNFNVKENTIQNLI